MLIITAMHRFFISSQFILNDSVCFEEKDLHQMSNVLRLKKKDRVLAWDENEKEYLVELTEVGPTIIHGKILKEIDRKLSGLKIILGQAIPKGRKIDFIIEKATELGIFGITPLITERVVIKIKDGEAKHKKERWQKIYGKPVSEENEFAFDEECEVVAKDNEQLNKVKVSDVPGDKGVTGIFDQYTEDGITLAQKGDFVVRIANGVSVQMNDLLESAGDGTARPQANDIVRSSTIGKVNMNIPAHVYPDGSWLCPVILT